MSRYEKSLMALIPLMLKGAKVAHLDWKIGQYIIVKDGKFYDNDDVIFTPDLYMFADKQFDIIGEVIFDGV